MPLSGKITSCNRLPKWALSTRHGSPAQRRAAPRKMSGQSAEALGRSVERISGQSGDPERTGMRSRTDGEG